MWLSPNIANVVNNYVGMTTIRRSYDHFKGTFIMSQPFDLYQIFNYNYKSFQKVDRNTKEK